MQNFQTNFNPFSQNIAIVKSYFKKPIVLTQGILYIVSAILNFASIFVVMPVMNNYFNMLFAIPEFTQGMTSADLEFFNTFMSVYTDIIVFASVIPGVIMLGLTAAAFFIIYMKSKNPDPGSSPKAGVTILFVLSIVQLIPIILASLILLLAIAVMIIASIVTSSSEAAEASTLLWIFTVIYAIVFGGMIAIFLLFFINQVRYYKSVQNSLTTVNLSNKGAGIFGVFSIIYGVMTALNSLSVFSITPTLNAMTELAPEISYIIDVFNSMTPLFIFSAGVSILTAAIYIISGIIALGYKNHIKAHTEGFSEFTTTPQTPYQYTESFPPSTQEEPVLQPAPQQEPTIAEPKNSEPQFQPVVFNDNTPIKQNTYCPRCGTPAKEGDVFCNACGTKL